MYVYHDDKGMITGILSGPGKTYGKDLDEHNILWIFLADADAIDPTKYYVDLQKKQTAIDNHNPNNNDIMPNFNDCIVLKTTPILACSNMTILANGVDEAIISQIPINARVIIKCGDRIEFDDIVSDGQIEISSDVPANFVILVIGINMNATTLTVTAT